LPRVITSVMNESPHCNRRAISFGSRTRMSTGNPAAMRWRMASDGRMRCFLENGITTMTSTSESSVGWP